MKITHDLKKVEDSFIAAALDPTRWDEAMTTVAVECGAAGALLFPLRGRFETLPMSASMKESTEYYFKEGWYLRDDRFRLYDRYVSDDVCDDFDLYQPKQLESLPYYQDFLGRFGLRWFAGVSIKTSNDIWCLSLQRTISAGPYLARHKLQLAILGRQLSNAALLAARLSAAKTSGVSDTLEALGIAAVLLNRHGMVVRANTIAEGLFGPDVCIRQQRVFVGHKQAAEHISNAINEVLSPRASRAARGPLVVPRQDKRPLVLNVLNLTGQDVNPFASASAIVLINDIDQQTSVPTSHLQKILGLTPAEAKLAISLSSGMPLALAADELEITAETARSRLKSIFAKTATNKQGALVALIARISRPFS